MKRYMMLFSFLINLFFAKAQKKEYNSYPVYTGDDLGLTYSPEKSVFRLWAPTADKIELLFYHNGTGDFPASSYEMTKGKNGTWDAVIYTDQKGKFYTFRANINGKWSDEVPDPYAKATGVNGKRAMVIDLQETNPAGWQNDKSPVLKNPTDAIIYELHVRDASIAPNSGIIHKEKFIGLTETGTKNPAGLSTGLDHIKELGVTHVHLLPVFDFYSIDETKPDSKYNWGYDPLNYNVPEGSYSTNPYDGMVRIKEFKQLIQSFHNNGLGVIMDVVYNHTALTEKSNFNQLVPGYYYRQTKDGKFSNATACGNETASERPMFRKFMLESMKYWVQQYHVDGFRIDLMGVHDIETINLISKELHSIKPDILLYGEGWTAGASPLPDSVRATKANASKLDRVAVFSDDIRDGIKGSVFKEDEKGFASGNTGMKESIKFGVAAACNHPQVDYTKVNYSKKAYADEPGKTISYCSCHDNHTLWDKLALSAKEATSAERVNMQKLSLAIVLTAQGIPFIHAGSAFLRSKKGVENSFESPDSINQIDWNLKTKNNEVFEFVKGLISMRKEHPAFRMLTAEEVKTAITFRDNVPEGVISYTIDGSKAGDSWSTIQVFYNGAASDKQMAGLKNWKIAVLNNSFSSNKEQPASVLNLSPYSCTILFQ